MEKSEFLHNFTKIYFSEVVKETILIENWEEGDFQSRYVEYADTFTRASNGYFTDDATDKEIIFNLSNDKKNIVKAFNDKISEHFLNEMKKQGIDETTAKQFINQNIPLGDKIRPDILEIFRSFEEESLKTIIGVA
ncbi:hypothetical protein R84B8_02386 [Treponema sp. R8-4-B8]